MRTHVTKLAALCLLVLVAGCDRNPRERLQGRWRGESIENVSGAQVEKARDFVRGMEFDFDGAKVTVTIPAESPRSGAYRLERTEGDRMLFSFAKRDAKERQEAWLRLAHNDSELRWRLGDGAEVVLIRAVN